ncbi:hypothetical protein R3I93_019896 [Phoxinus phoxinus]|uniref:Transposase domain-containing protein n=1 Tax=Phoxinus phoxinus TaxID=58324 RepID=A0AAN9GV03_9TELE
MTSKERRRQYNTIWARVSRAQKKAANKETVSSVEMTSIPETDIFSHSQLFEEENLIFSDPALSSSESEQDSIPMLLREQLSEWACVFLIKHNAVDALLNILKKHGHEELPQTARTLFGNENHHEVSNKDGVESVKFNVADQLSKHLSRYPASVTDHLQSLDLSMNIDGLPLFKSSNVSLWPVLCCINLSPECIFPLCISTAASKPKTLTFVNDTVQELKELIQDGLTWGGRCLNIQVRCITCDAPAKAMVKCVKQFSGYYGCDRCNQRGSWDGRITYPETNNLTMRTDESFRECWQPEHHQEEQISPFSVLPIDMIKSFPIDYMHQSCLGVMKKLLLLWTRGRTDFRMSSGDVTSVSERLVTLKKSIPDCFARKPRDLKEIERWKATEFRQFALYTGKIVLKGVLNDQLYEHFLCFSTALCILVSPDLSKSQAPYANQLLKYFVERGRELYGETFLVYNVHSLLHLAEDAQNFGSLDSCSAFKFESYLYQMKKMVRSGKNILAQVANRLEETSKSKMENKTNVMSFKCPNNVFVLSPEQCCEVVSEEVDNTVLCRVYTNLQPYVMTPCDSRLYGTYTANIRHSQMLCLERQSLQRRAFIVEENYGTKIVVSILHTF